VDHIRLSTLRPVDRGTCHRGSRRCSAAIIVVKSHQGFSMVLVPADARLVERLTRLIDADPVAAIREARLLSPDPGAPEATVKAAILVDGGARAKDAEAIAAGTDLFRLLSESNPARVDLSYNLANGLVALANLDQTPVPHWYGVTAAMRHEARQLYASVSRTPAQNALATQAMTNLGNALDRAHRWAEAYDAYVEALRTDARNGMASGCAAQLVWRCIRLRLGDRDRLTDLALAYGRHTRDHVDETRAYGGLHAVEEFAQLPAGDSPPSVGAETGKLDPYAAFARRHRLMLVPFVEGVDMTSPRWDTLSVSHFTEGIDTPSEPPSIFAMFNTMKEDFLLARYLAHVALEGEVPDPGEYVDTLDYANYGTRSAALRLAQRLALDVLDKIAGAVNDLLSVGLPHRKVYFTNLWHETDGSLRPAVAAEIERRNWPVLALSEVRQDLVGGGYLEGKRSLRHSSTHRFTVLHDMLVGGFRDTPVVEHYDEAAFSVELIETLRLCRAALLYFVEMLRAREAATETSDFSVPLFLPLHHEIRGE
jgi:hypothetical protein